MFRNREIVKIGSLFVVLAGVGATVCYAIHPMAGLVSLLMAIGLGGVFWGFTKAHYGRISRISEQIDQILHDAEHLYISEEEEGELSVLQSEITKMTLRIQEQNRKLGQERERLADSLADIAHQLKTPLTSANLILTLLKNNPGRQRERALLREMEQLFVQMEWLLASLLKLSRLDAGIVVFQREEIEVKALLGAALRPFLVSMDLHRVRLMLKIPEGVCVRGDAMWLCEGIQNILKNSLESVGDGGEIEISCEDTLLYTEISLRDSGPGFDREDLLQVFSRFYRGKNSDASGYGIGMALSKKIIAGQGAMITAENHPQGGALFRIRFPK